MPKTIKCYCKVNLSLKIIKYSKRYKKHFLSSVFLRSNQFVDTLIITKKSLNPGVYTKIENKDVILSDQILDKVINYLANHYKIDLSKVRIQIIKNIPIGAGLGGGSSDAASFIKWFYQAYKIPMRKQIKYLEIARTLGSDIPFFLSGFKIAKVEGIGEKIFPIKTFKINHNIIINKVICKTSEVFSHYQSNAKNQKNSANDLMDSVFILYPELKKIYEQLKSKNKNVILSGSGSSFVILEKEYKYE